MKIKASAARAMPLLCVVLAMLSTTSLAAADDIPTLTVKVDHDEADTWSSVLVQIRIDPFRKANNTTYHVSRVITVVLTNIDEPKELVRNENVTLDSGIAVYNFRVKPDWGEFLLAIDVFDPLTGAEARQTVKIVYSVEHVMYLMRLEHDEDLERVEEKYDVASAKMQDTWLLMALLVFVMLPIVTIKLEHRTARHEGKSSFWDKAQDRHFNFTLVRPVLHQYLEDNRYEFQATGRRTHKEVRVQSARVAVRADMVALQRIDDALGEELREFEAPKAEQKPVTAKGIATAVTAKTEKEMEREAMLKGDREERLAAEDEYDVEET